MRKFLLGLALACAAFAADSRPKVRAITAFIHIDPPSYEQQYADTIEFLDFARAAFRDAGFEVESVRIVTQPFPEYIRGMSPESGVHFGGGLGKLGRDVVPVPPNRFDRKSAARADSA